MRKLGCEGKFDKWQKVYVWSDANLNNDVKTFGFPTRFVDSSRPHTGHLIRYSG